MNLCKLHTEMHNEIRAIINYHGAQDLADDIEQDFYIKADKALRNGKAEVMYEGGKWNKPYIFTMVRNAVMDAHRKQARSRECSIEGLDFPDDTQEHHKIDTVMRAIEHISYWYDRQIITHYLFGGYTIRALASETGISQSSIFTSIKHSKQFIIKFLSNEKT